MTLPVVWWLVLALAAVQALLKWRRAGLFTWSLVTWLSIWVFLRFGFVVPVPQSVITLYMAIATGSIAAYVSSSRERLRQFTRPVESLIVAPERRRQLAVVLVALPLLAAFAVYRSMRVELEAPAFGRTIHPAPPDTISVHGQTYNLITLDNPYRSLERSDPAAFRERVENGRRVYFENCVFCHGDALRGDGMYIRGLNPLPTNFADAGAIALLQESFLFWRIAKGGPGLPEEGGPWDTAMPAWEKFLTVDEMWDVILFMYEFSGQRPRAREEVH